MTTHTVSREEIGKRIKAGRILRGWDQTEFSRELILALDDRTWTSRVVSNIETGKKKIDAEVLAVIADLEGQPIGWYYEGGTVETRARSSIHLITAQPTPALRAVA